MTLGTDVKTTVDNIITNLGSDIVFSSYAGTSNIYGDYIFGTTITNTTIKAVPIDYVFPTNSYQQFGIEREGDFELVVKGDQAVNGTAIVAFQSQTYQVQSINTVHFQNVDLVKIVSMVKRNIN